MVAYTNYVPYTKGETRFESQFSDSVVSALVLATTINLSLLILCRSGKFITPTETTLLHLKKIKFPDDGARQGRMLREFCNLGGKQFSKVIFKRIGVKESSKCYPGLYSQAQPQNVVGRI